MALTRRKTDRKPTAKYVLSIEHDGDVGNPCEEGDGKWQIYSFSNRHNHFKNPDSFRDEEGNWLEEIKTKLENGLAFLLDYHEHGLCMWSLTGDGPQCQWDTARCAGIAVWEEPEENIGAKDYEGRKKDVEGALVEFTDWCNGNCYYFRWSEANNDFDKDGIGEALDSCGGIIGSDYLPSIIRENMPEDATEENTRIIGEAKDSINVKDIFKKD